MDIPHVAPLSPGHHFIMKAFSQVCQTPDKSILFRLLKLTFLGQGLFTPLCTVLYSLVEYCAQEHSIVWVYRGAPKAIRCVIKHTLIRFQKWKPITCTTHQCLLRTLRCIWSVWHSLHQVSHSGRFPLFHLSCDAYVLSSDLWFCRSPTVCQLNN